MIGVAPHAPVATAHLLGAGAMWIQPGIRSLSRRYDLATAIAQAISTLGDFGFKGNAPFDRCLEPIGWWTLKPSIGFGGVPMRDDGPTEHLLEAA